MFNSLIKKKQKKWSQVKEKRNMRNITINIPNIYDANLLKLQKLGLLPSRSEGVRIAIREFLQNEYKIMHILGCFED